MYNLQKADKSHTTFIPITTFSNFASECDVKVYHKTFIKEALASFGVMRKAKLIQFRFVSFIYLQNLKVRQLPQT